MSRSCVQAFNLEACCHTLLPRISHFRKPTTTLGYSAFPFNARKPSSWPLSSFSNQEFSLFRQPSRGFCGKNPVRAQVLDQVTFNPALRSRVDSCFRDVGESASRSRHGFRFSENSAATSKAEGSQTEGEFIFWQQNGITLDKVFHNAHILARQRCKDHYDLERKTIRFRSYRIPYPLRMGPNSKQWRPRNRAPLHKHEIMAIARKIFLRVHVVRREMGRRERLACAKHADQIHNASHRQDMEDAAAKILPSAMALHTASGKRRWRSLHFYEGPFDEKNARLKQLFDYVNQKERCKDTQRQESAAALQYMTEPSSADINEGAVAGDKQIEPGGKELEWQCPISKMFAARKASRLAAQRLVERQHPPEPQERHSYTQRADNHHHRNSEHRITSHFQLPQPVNKYHRPFHIPIVNRTRPLTRRSYHTTSLRGFSPTSRSMTESLVSAQEQRPSKTSSVPFFKNGKMRAIFQTCTDILSSLVRVSLTAIPLLWRWNMFSRYPGLACFALALPLSSMAIILILTCEEHPLTGRARFMLVNEKQELQEAEKSYGTLLMKHKDDFLPSDHPHYQAVFNALRPLLSIVGPLREWELHVVSDDSCHDAFITPSGKIFIFTGILGLAQSREGIAAVIAHEIAHVLSRHGAEKFGANSLMDLGAIFLHSALYTLSVNLPVLTDILGRLMTSLKIGLGKTAYSRLCESEADLVGMYLMSLAGYDPMEAITFWNRMAHVDHSHEERGLLSTHPSHAERAQHLEPYLLQAQDLYEQRKEISIKFIDTHRQWRRGMKGVNKLGKDSTTPSKQSLDEFNSMLSFILEPHLRI